MTISKLCNDDNRKWDYLSGEPPIAKRREMERHLVDCPGCQTELDDLRMLGERLRSMAPPECPDELVQSTLNRLAQYERLTRRFRGERQIALAILGALALTVVFVLGAEMSPGFWPAGLL